MDFTNAKGFECIILDVDSDAETFKRVVLPIIFSIAFTETFVEQRSFELLKKGVQEYTRLYKAQTGVEPRNSGGSTYLRGLKNYYNNLDEIITQFNQIGESVNSAIISNLARLLGTSGPNKLQSVNQQASCQFLFHHKLKAIQDFTCTFKAKNGNSYFDFEDFINSGAELAEVSILLVGPQKLPALLAADGESDRDQHFVGHYLNSENFPLMASIVFKRKNWKVVQVLLTQFQDIAGHRPGIQFTSVEGGIINGDGDDPLIITQKSVPKSNTDFYKKNPQFQTLTVSKEVIDGCRYASFTSIVKHSRSEGLQYPVGGLVILQQFESEPDLLKLNDLLTDYDNTAEGVDHMRDVELRHKIFQIRYRLHGSNFNYREETFLNDTRSWNALNNYAGKYICYYMRLSNPPGDFQTSRIEIFPDGSATLEQSPDDNIITPGRVRVQNARVWIYFGHNPITGESPIRFLVDEASEESREMKLRGIFQSETLVKQFLVSGLMSMTRIEPNGSPMLNEQVWPKFFSKPCNELVKSDFRDNSDFTFFVSGKAQGHFLSDGPAWADISDRLSDTSSVDRIAGLMLDDQKERGETEFYYYTFKKDVNDLQNVIERNLVRFYAYGKVTVLASEGIEYSGKAYFMKSTLRLSLVNQLGGFLEVFLKLNGDKSSMQRPNILYGASLWHSDDRIQAKTVVLSRSGVSNFHPKAKFFGFDEEKHFKDLEAEDVLTGGLISYLRGESNRFLHSPKEPLPNLFRPRDKTSRQFHFFIACFYGYRLKLHLGERPYIDDEEFQIIQGHIKNAFIHGYSVPFAGLENSKTIDLKSRESIRKAYLNQFFPQESQNGKRDQLAKTPIKKIISQIQEIAEEQEFLVSAFNPGGPLDNEELYGYASLLWPNLLPKRNTNET